MLPGLQDVQHLQEGESLIAHPPQVSQGMWTLNWNLGALKKLKKQKAFKIFWFGWCLFVCLFVSHS